MVSCFSQFHVVKEEKNWTEAQKYCRGKFTDLATIENQEEMDAVKAALNGTAGHFWIGLRQKPGENNRSWIWSDGSNFSYSDWNTAEPNNNGSDNCVQLYRECEYRWNDAGCHWPGPFVCYEIPLTLIKQNKTWREALRYCREKHVDLVSVHTEDIQHQVKIISQNASTDNVWMGLRHTCTLSFWFWVSGESICYQNWAPGNGTEEEDCSGRERTGAVQSGSKQWVSLPETQKLNFICSTMSEENWKKNRGV
ncbi:macrophage mannose receptor 1-like [Salminus brasiliensis]|uniref:macrophage mannose receptor 1-like n=1 Tax=Salminus brasiliensis TaxID=930266 RepID=UPI003B83525C